MLHWLIYSDRLSAVRGECCMSGRSADAGLTANKIFKSRQRYHGSDVPSQNQTMGEEKKCITEVQCCVVVTGTTFSFAIMLVKVLGPSD